MTPNNSEYKFAKMKTHFLFFSFVLKRIETNGTLQKEHLPLLSWSPFLAPSWRSYLNLFPFFVVKNVEINLRIMRNLLLKVLNLL